MPEYTQEGQPIRVDTVLGDDVLLLAAYHGREEISQPFAFELELLSEDPNLDAADLLRTPASIGVLLPDGEVRRIHGRIRSFGYEGQRADLSYYRAELVPWVWFLSLSTDCRIFQNLSVPDIVAEVFAQIDGARFRTQFSRDYPEREYCVQYRESNLHFVSRLMEEEGIFYFFEHSEEGDTLVLADYPQMQPCEGQSRVQMHLDQVPREDVVRALTQKQSVHTGTMTLGDYDQFKPSLELRSSVAGDEPDEAYQYQKHLFSELSDGERFARIALEREEAQHHVVQGKSTCRGFQVGRRFELTKHPREAANREYALLEVRHMARNGSYLAGADTGLLDYENRFRAIPHGTPYRPPLRARKPIMPGNQTARVVGPAGEKINVDEYGRVKIQFHWDRLGSNDANSSCWVRVSQNWAGKRWGGMFIPHIDQEVIVSFLEGDPDRPIITGRVYNAEHMPPQDLPANKHKSIIEDDFGNEVVLDGTPGAEHIRIHSPNHTSTMELGRSLKFKCESDWTKMIEGKAGSIHKGPQIGGNIGTKIGIDLGGSFSAFVGFKFDVSIAEAFKVELGPSVKIATGEEYKFSKSAFKQQSKKEVLLSSEKSTVMIGGSGKESIVDGNAERLVLQYGKAAKKEKSVVAKIAHIAAFSAGLAGGLTSSVLASTDWTEEGEADMKSFAILGAGGIIPAIHGAAGLIERVKGATKKETLDDSDSLHGGGGSKHSNATLNKEGVFLTAYGSSREAWLSLFGSGSQAGSAALRSTKKMELISRSISLESDTLLGLTAKNVVIDSNAITKIKGGQLVKIG